MARSDNSGAMTPRSARLVAAFAVLAAAFASSVGANVPAASAGVTTRTPVMGPSLLDAQQLAAWYDRNHGSIQPRIPVLHNNVAALAQIYIDEGNAEGVRGDIAFVQSMLETGWLGFAGSQIPPDAYNYAGINAFDGRSVATELPDGRLDTQPVHGTPATRRAHADPTPAQLRRSDHQDHARAG